MGPRSATDLLTAELARAVVEKIAPEELAAFDLVAAPYLTGVDTSKSSGDLEFGVVEAVATITPVVTVVCAAVSLAVLHGVEDEVRKTSGEVTRGVFRRLWRKRGQPQALAWPAWTREQLAEVRTVAVERAVSLRVELALAEAIADAVVGALVLGPERSV